MDKNEFINEVETLGIRITDEMLIKLDMYYKMLIEYNNHINLTRITNEKEVYLKHFYDSLTLVKTVKLDKESLLDVGSGAGFPGVVLKIVFPNLKVTLVDSLNKRVTFLNAVIEKLQLKDINAVHARAEEYINSNREKFYIVTSRAVANLNMLSELCIPYVKVNGCFIAMKAAAKEEIKLAKNAIKTLGGVIKNSVIFNLPHNSGQRTLIKIVKVQKTSVKYPRKFNEIKKKPL